MLKAAEACHKADMTFGLGLGQTPDSVDMVGVMFRGFGAALVARFWNTRRNYCNFQGSPCAVLTELPILRFY